MKSPSGGMGHAVLAPCRAARDVRDNTLEARSTLLSGSQTAAVICASAFASLGLRCMINMLLGMKPRFLRIASNCSFNSGECSGGSGISRVDGVVR